MCIQKQILTKIGLLFCFVLFWQMSMAQRKIKGSVTRAETLLSKSDIAQAKLEIDAAYDKEIAKLKSKGKDPVAKPRTYFVKGKVYQAIYNSEDKEINALSDNPVQVAIDSYQEVMKHGKSTFVLAATQNKQRIYADTYTKAVKAYNEKDFKSAMFHFEKAKIANPMDTNIYVNIVSCASVLEDKEVILKYCKKLQEFKYEKNWIYTTPVSYAMQDKDYEKALPMIEEGLKAFPNDKDLISQRSQLYVETGRTEEAIQSFEKLAKAQPDNALIHYNIAVLCERSDQKEKAAVFYQKALDIKPDYYDALYNLGALYFNASLKINKELQNIPLDKMGNYMDKAKAEELEAKIKEQYKKTYPLFEQAIKQKNDEKIVYELLQRVYYVLEMKEDEARIKSILATFK